MKRVDIESLVRWAYRQELPKRDNVASAAGARWMETGVSGSGSGMPAPAYREWMGEAHPDAIAIEAAIGRLQELAFEWADLRRLTLGAAGEALRLRDVKLPDGRWTQKPLDACLVTLSMRPAMLIVMHARAASRPDCSQVPRVAPLRQGANGKPVVWRVDPATGEQAFVKERGTGLMMADAAYDLRMRMRSGAACPVVFEPSLASVARDRAEYLIWLAGLDVLAADLGDSLVEHVALPPEAPRKPWAGVSRPLLAA